jgi:hypothetical protein
MNILKLGLFHRKVAERYTNMVYEALYSPEDAGEYASEESYRLLAEKFEKLLRRSNERREKLLQRELQQTMYCLRWQ